MKLIKYCSKEFNPLAGCNTLQLGTLDDFRSKYLGEKDFINDLQEGKASGKDGNGNIFIHQKIHNCYIFCVSRSSVKEQDIKEGFSANYDSSYEIINPELFKDRIVNLLYEQLTLDDFKTEFAERIKNHFTLANFHRIQILTAHHTVGYSDAKSFQINSQKDLVAATLFNKTIKYKHQFEYRFAFMPFHDELGYIPVVERPKILDLRNLKPIISNVSQEVIYENNLFVGPQ